MRKYDYEFTTYSPGLVSDLNDSKNPGMISMVNFRTNSMGKLEKRKGWDVIYDYASMNAAEGNLPIQFTDRQRPDLMYARATIESGITYTDIVLYYDATKSLVVNRFQADGTFVYSKVISIETYWKKSGPVTFVPTNDQLYIINGYREDADTGGIFKYNFAEDNKEWDFDGLQNVTQQKMSKDTVLTILHPASIYTLTAGKFYMWKICPQYSTSAVGKAALIQHYGVSTGIQRLKVFIDIKSPYDPYIKSYKIYRTKGLVYPSGVSDGTAQAATHIVDDEWAKNENFYFLDQVDAPANDTNPVENVLIYTDEMKDNRLGSLLSDEAVAINTYAFDLCPNRSELPSEKLGDSTGNNINCTCGCFANNTLILGGDYDLPAKVYVSEHDMTDIFQASKVYNLPLANKNNPVTAIKSIGTNVFIFCKSCIYIMRPSASPSIPYSLELLTEEIGIDGSKAVTVMGSTGYFITEGKLYSMSAFGEYNEVGGTINKKLAEFYTENNTSKQTNINLFSNSKETSILLTIPRENETPINLWIYPSKDLIVTEEGYRDIFTRTRVMHGTQAIVELTQKDGRYQLLSYQYNADLKEEWGITYDGDLVKRKDDTADYIHTDTSKSAQKTTWGRYIAINQPAPIQDYIVEGVYEKAFNFPNNVLMNSMTFYGTGKIWISVSGDGESYDEEVELELDSEGVEFPIGLHCRLFKFKLKHIENNDIDLDYITFKVSSDAKLDIKKITNSGSGGE